MFGSVAFIILSTYSSSSFFPWPEMSLPTKADARSASSNKQAFARITAACFVLLSDVQSGPKVWDQTENLDLLFI